MTTSDLVAALALVVAAGSLFNSWWQGRNSNAIAEKANAIAAQSLELTRARAQAEDLVFVQPLRLDPAGNRVFFQVTSTVSVSELEFEYLNYASVGGVFRRTMVPPGDLGIDIRDFAESEGTLTTPGSREFAATARWRRSPNEPWSTCGTYIASKDRYTFRRT